jgi:uncharacterized alkaline shock family protein YloU
MIKISNHLGTISVSKKYLKKLVVGEVSDCFGISGLHSAEITQVGSELDVKLTVTAADDVNIPAVANAVSHRVAYVLTRKTGVSVRSVEIYAEGLS